MEEVRRTTTTEHAYPADLAALVRERCDGGAIPLPPDQGTLEALISTCYQASLLREEERSVTFRAILCDPSELPPLAGPLGDVHVLEFPSLRPFDIQEVRRLSPAADYYRTLIGVCSDEEEGLRIWGLVISSIPSRAKTRWLPLTRFSKPRWTNRCSVCWNGTLASESPLIIRS